MTVLTRILTELIKKTGFEIYICFCKKKYYTNLWTVIGSLSNLEI